MAPVGRWQKGRDLLWYTRAAGVVSSDTNRSVGERHSNVDDAVRSEASLVRRREEEAMRAALGLPPLRDTRTSSSGGDTLHRLEKQELATLLSRRGNTNGNLSEPTDAIQQSEELDLAEERVNGVGFRSRFVRPYILNFLQEAYGTGQSRSNLHLLIDRVLMLLISFLDPF